MSKIGLLFVGLLGLLFLVNTCSAVDFQVSPDVKIAHPGDTVSYVLNVSLTADDDPNYFPINEEFSIDNPIQDWGYSFSRKSVTLDNSSTTNTSVLNVMVPSNASPGPYTHWVNATGYDSNGMLIGVPTQIDIRVVTTDVSVPEFPSVALPVAAVLGLIVVFGRKK